MEGYAEYAVQKKLTAKDRMPIVASVFAAIIGFAIWTFVPGNAGRLGGPIVLVLGIVAIIFFATRQELEYEYIFVNGDCDIAKIIKKSSRRQVYSFEAGKVQKVIPVTSIRFDNEQQANPSMQIVDFTSGYPETKERWYAFFNNRKNHTEAVVLELNEKCVEHVKQFYKDKYIE